MNTIAVDNITKTYGDFLAVSELTFEVREGEIFALLGPNGAGKSTSIRMILDIIKPDTGTIQVLGQALTPELRDYIGYLPEERGLYKNARVQEMMVYLARLKGMSRQDAMNRSKALLEQLDLGDHLKSKVSELSKGMQQKVQFAVTVLHQPRLIIVDEPFSGLDPVNRLVIKDLLLDFRRGGGSIVMSTHQMNQVEEMADRLLMISHGRQKLYGAVGDIREQYASHAIIVEGTGNWATIPGITQVDEHHGERDAFVLRMSDDVHADDILGHIARAESMRLTRFERAIPSLDEIFIRVAGESAEGVQA
jgi:ABC-2 type transport system ATP-binding protein